MLNFFKFLS